MTMSKLTVISKYSRGNMRSIQAWSRFFTNWNRNNTLKTFESKNLSFYKLSQTLDITQGTLFF